MNLIPECRRLEERFVVDSHERVGNVSNAVLC